RPLTIGELVRMLLELPIVYHVEIATEKGVVKLTADDVHVDDDALLVLLDAEIAGGE
ncbi:MAG: hypothetical protein GY803_07000, partial [Chloroflexi bacterium]|nr:hypothetical protein [Chloroflexota bacterium]